MMPRRQPAPLNGPPRAETGAGHFDAGRPAKIRYKIARKISIKRH